VFYICQKFGQFLFLIDFIIIYHPIFQFIHSFTDWFICNNYIKN